MLKKPGVLVQVFTLVMAFICMFIMYGAQQYTKAFGMANLGLDEMAVPLLPPFTPWVPLPLCSSGR